jgi:hypothetical protein
MYLGIPLPSVPGPINAKKADENNIDKKKKTKN